jgi:RND family efflux transporter MFP subunit
VNNSFTQKILLAVACAVFVVSSTHSAQADDEKPEKKTHTVQEQPLKIEIELQGTAVAEKMTEVAVEPQSWTTWIVEEAVAHGIHVRKGDVLVRFKTKNIDEAIADLEVELELTDLTIAQADRELPLFKKTLAMDTADAERAHRITMEDTQHFMDNEKELDLKSTKFSLKSSQQRYENVLEELVQLEKMYDADDLIEETEEIILKRQRHSVASAKLSLERATIAHDRALRVGLPRQIESVQRKLDRSELSTTKATSEVELTLKRKQLEQAKQKLQRGRSQEKLAMLQHDREAMVVHAPAAGTIYYGQCVDGKWGKIASMRPKLRRHGKVLANEVIMTVVGDGPIYIAATVPEAHLSDIQPAMEAAVSFAALGENKVKGRIESISSTLVAEGKYATKLTLTNNGRIERLTPGMSCKIKLVTYANRSALLIPTSAVVADPWDDQVQHVILVDDDGNETKQSVETGREKEDSIEILSGLELGNNVLLDAKSKGE